MIETKKACMNTRHNTKTSLTNILRGIKNGIPTLFFSMFVFF